MRMRTRRMIVVLFVVVICVMVSGSVFGQEAKFELKKDYGMKEILTGYAGKRVAIRLEAGEELEGIVTTVGDHLVHLSKLSKRDFYDALIRIDKITGVVIRVRSN